MVVRCPIGHSSSVEVERLPRAYAFAEDHPRDHAGVGLLTVGIGGLMTLEEREVLHQRLTALLERLVDVETEVRAAKEEVKELTAMLELRV